MPPHCDRLYEKNKYTFKLNDYFKLHKERNQIPIHTSLYLEQMCNIKFIGQVFNSNEVILLMMDVYRLALQVRLAIFSTVENIPYVL